MKKISEKTIESCLNTLKKEAEFYLDCPIESVIKDKKIIVMYKHDEIYEYDTTEVLEEDFSFKYIMYEKLFRDFIEEIQEYEDIDDNKDEIMEIYRDTINEYIFYKIKNNKIKTLEKALKIIRPIGFWMPIAVIIDDEWHSTWQLGAQDENGNTMGIRF